MEFDLRWRNVLLMTFRRIKIHTHTHIYESIVHISSTFVTRYLPYNSTLLQFVCDAIRFFFLIKNKNVFQIHFPFILFLLILKIYLAYTCSPRLNRYIAMYRFCKWNAETRLSRSSDLWATFNPNAHKDGGLSPTVALVARAQNVNIFRVLWRAKLSR